MDTRRRNNSWIICFASAFVVATVSSAQTNEYDFQELLLGLTSDSREGQTRAEEEVRKTLKGREREVWNFVLSALSDTEGKYDSGHVSEGLRALTVLDGFNDEILDEYRDLLRRESNEIENLKELESKRLRRVQTKEEWRSITKRMRFIEYGLYTSEDLGRPLPREIVTPFLPFDDQGIIEPVIRWYYAHGVESDIKALTKRAEEFAKIGGTIYRDAIVEAVTEIRTRGAAELTPATMPVHESSADGRILDADSDRSVRETSRAEGSPPSPAWPYGLCILLIVGVTVFHVRRILRRP